MADIKINAKLTSPKGKPAPIYRLATRRVNEKAIRELANRLGLQADAKSGVLGSDADKLTFSVGHLELTMHRASGAVRFIDRARWQVDDRQSDLKIEDAVASVPAQGETALRHHRRVVRTHRQAIGLILAFQDDERIPRRHPRGGVTAPGSVPSFIHGFNALDGLQGG